MKILFSLYLLLLHYLLADFVSYPLASLFQQSAESLSINNGTNVIPTFLTSAGFSASQIIINYSGANQAIILNFNFIAVILTTDSAKTLSFSFKTSIGDVGGFQLVLSSKSNTLTTPTTCLTNPITGVLPATTLSKCTSSTGETFKLTIALTGSVNGWTINSGTGSTNAYTFFNINIIYEYDPSVAANTKSVTLVEAMTMGYSMSGTGALYNTFTGGSVALSQCPSSCISCSSNSICLTCQSGFYLIGGICSCAGTLIDYLSKDSNSMNSQVASSFYLSTTSCLTINQYGQQIIQTRTCQTALTNLFLSNQIVLQASTSSANSGINIVLSTQNSTTNTQILSACLNQTYFVNAIQLGIQSNIWSLEISLNSESQIVLNQQFPISFPISSYCSSVSYASFGLMATKCIILTTFFMRMVSFNSTLASFQNQFLTIKGSGASSQMQLFVPIYANNPNISMQTTGNFSAIVCLDALCATPLTNNMISANQTIFIKIIFYDPLLNYYKPQIFSSLNINQTDFSSAILNTTIEEQQLYTDYVLRIEVSSTKLIGTVSFNLTLNAAINTPALYSSVSTLGFLLTVNPVQVVHVPFAQSFQFLVLIFSVALIVVFIAFSFLAYFIDLARGSVTSVKHVRLPSDPSPNGQTRGLQESYVVGTYGLNAKEKTDENMGTDRDSAQMDIKSGNRR